jgi:hypothetical protein
MRWVYSFPKHIRRCIPTALCVWCGKKRYQRDGINLTLDFNKELQEVSMARFDDPNIMLDKLEALSARYTTLGLRVLDDTIIARALVIAPLEYASALTAEKRMKEMGHSLLSLCGLPSRTPTLS